MIVYVGIFSIIITIIMQLSLQVQFAGVRTSLANEINENASQAMQHMIATLREAEVLSPADSIFDQHPGKFAIDGAQFIVFDTYEKEVQLGGESVTIRKLRKVEDGSAFDLTTDHADVSDFQIKNLSHGGQPATLQIFLELSSVNPVNDPNFEKNLPLRTTVSLRQQP